MPTDLVTATNRFSDLSAAQVLAEQTRLLAQYAVEDAARRARNTATLAALDVRS